MTRSPKLLPGSESLTYRLQISRRRRTVGLTVTDTGKLLVHAPRGLALEAVHRVIKKNRAWIEKKQAKRREAWARLEDGKVYYRGKALPLERVSQGPLGIRLVGDTVLMCLKRFSEDPWPQLLAWYRQEAEALLTERVHHFAARIGLTPPRVEVRTWRRRWGDCRPDGRLRFNWRLVLLPMESLDYVVVHELAHLLVPGHPPRFWQEVGKYLPDYADRRRWLKAYGPPFLLWEFKEEKRAGA
jgi:predicted metal-dependent hydrolase